MMVISGNRKNIYDYILNYPGVYLRQIHRQIGSTMSDIQYHLRYLENIGLIKSRKVNQNRHFYPITIVDEQDEIVLAFLRHNTDRSILICLLEHSGYTQTDVINSLNLSASTINWHMFRLVESGLISKSKQGKIIRYFVADAELLVDSLRKYFPDMWNKLADRFVKLYIQSASTHRIVPVASRRS